MYDDSKTTAVPNKANGSGYWVIGDYNNYTFEQQGWECPRCHRINAPWMPFCYCEPPKVEITTNLTTTTHGGRVCGACGNSSKVGYNSEVTCNIDNKTHKFGDICDK